MRWPWVSREAVFIAQATTQATVSAARMEIAAERARYDKLFAAYEKLRLTSNPAEPQPPVVTSPIADLGPQTLAALDAMGKGQTGMVKRAMQARAVQLWHEMQDADDRDNAVAKAVWHGEAVMPS